MGSQLGPAAPKEGGRARHATGPEHKKTAHFQPVRGAQTQHAGQKLRQFTKSICICRGCGRGAPCRRGRVHGLRRPAGERWLDMIHRHDNALPNSGTRETIIARTSKSRRVAASNTSPGGGEKRSAPQGSQPDFSSNAGERVPWLVRKLPQTGTLLQALRRNAT